MSAKAKPDSDTARDEVRDRDRDVLTDTLSGKQGRMAAGPVLTDTLSGEAKNVPVLPPPCIVQSPPSPASSPTKGFGMQQQHNVVTL